MSRIGPPPPVAVPVAPVPLPPWLEDAAPELSLEPVPASPQAAKRTANAPAESTGARIAAGTRSFGSFMRASGREVVWRSSCNRKAREVRVTEQTHPLYREGFAACLEPR